MISLALKIRNAVFILFFSVLALSALWEENRPAIIKEKLDGYHTERPIEKVYVHLDRQHYTLSDSAWFKVYLLDGQQHLPSPISKLVYVELLSPENELIATRHIHIEQGIGIGDFITEKEWAPGEYVIRAYTEYMRNFDEAFFFRRTIRLWNAQSEIRKEDAATTSIDPRQSNEVLTNSTLDYDLQFFPEGGDLVYGLSSVVAFKALDETGQGAQVEGVILDNKNQMTTFVKSIEFGMGFFSFRPQAGKNYRAEVMSNGVKKTFPLPAARPKGYVLKMKQRSEDQIDLEVTTNFPKGLGGAFVIGHLRGQTFCTIEAPENTNSFVTAISTSELPNGVAHFTLFSSEGLPVCERLVFINHSNNQCHLKTTANSSDYQPREKVDISLELMDEQENSISGNISLSVTDLYSAPHDVYGEDIRTYVLLNSDLKGHIENPAYFFEANNPGRRQLLNLLMMTHGWRRFNWEKVMNNEFPEVAYAPEWGFSLSGYTSQTNNKQPVEADLFISTMSQPFLMEQLTTGVDGRFGIHGLALFDTTSIIFQANTKNRKREERRRKKGKDQDETGPGGNRNISIHLDERNPPAPLRAYAYPLPQPGEDLIEELLRESRQIRTIDSAYQAIWNIDLGEVTVRAKSRKPSVFDLADEFYEKPDNRFLIDSFPSAPSKISVLEFLKGRVPGLEILGFFPDYSIRIRGNSTIVGDNTPLFVLDGVPLGGAEAISRIASIPMPSIAYVDVIKGLRTQSFGQVNTGGVIAIYTRAAVGMQSLRGTRTYPGIKQYLLPGFYRAREFYAPAYDLPQKEVIKPDYRTTLFWAPSITLDQNGRATASFYTSDKASSYRIVVEGMTDDGRPVRAVERVNVSY